MLLLFAVARIGHVSTASRSATVFTVISRCTYFHFSFLRPSDDRYGMHVSCEIFSNRSIGVLSCVCVCVCVLFVKYEASRASLHSIQNSFPLISLPFFRSSSSTSIIFPLKCVWFHLTPPAFPSLFLVVSIHLFLLSVCVRVCVRVSSV